MDRACAGLRWSVVVVENLPRGGPPLTDEFPWARVVRNAVPVGFGQNHNGVLAPVVSGREARYVLVLNDDTELTPGSITALVRHADERPGVGATGPRLLWPDGSPQHSFYAFPSLRGTVLASFRPSLLPDTPIEAGPGWLGGACLLLRAEALRKVGMFDTRYFLFFEDVDLAARLYEGGWTIDVCRTSSVIHRGHETILQPELRLPMERQMLRSSYLYFRKHQGPVAAHLAVGAARCGLLLRAISSRFGRRPGAVTDLFQLARYAPTVPLPHEVEAGKVETGR